jgi:YD repeat-containing protein
VIVHPEDGRLHVEAVDGGSGQVLEVRRVYHDAAWRFGFDLALEIAPGGVALITLDETLWATPAPDTLPDWPAGTRFEGEDFTAELTHSGWQVTRGNETLIFDEAGHLLSHATPAGTRTHKWKNDQLQEIRAGDGRALSLNRDAAGRLVEIRMPDGRKVSYEYRGDLLVAAQSRDQPRSRYVYDGEKRLKVILWPDASQVSFQRDSAGRVSGVHGPGPETLSLSWSDKLLTLRQGTGAVTRISQRTGGVRVQGPLGHVVTLREGPDGVLGWTDPQGLETRIQRTPQGSPSLLSSPGGAQWNFGWRDGGLVTVTDPAGGRWRLDRNTSGQVVGITDPDSRKARIQRNQQGTLRTLEKGSAPLRIDRDAQGRITAIQDSTGATTRLRRNDAGQLLQVKDPAGNALTLTGHRSGHPTTLLERDGGTWTVERDSMGRVEHLDTPTGGNLLIQRDRTGRPVVIQNRNGASIRYAWNSAGHLTRIKDSIGGTWNLRYDAAGRLVGIKRPDGSQVTASRNANSEITRVALNETSTEIQRDARGNPVEVGPMQWKWDAASRWLGATTPTVALALVRSGSGAVRSIQVGTDAPIPVSRDAGGNVVGFGISTHRTTLARDGAGRIVGIQQPGQTAIRIHRDERGLPARVNAGPLETRISRDAAGRPLKWTAADGTVVSVNRDLAGHVSHLRLPDGSLTRFVRTDQDLRLQLADPQGKLILERAVEWNKAGQVVRRTEAGLRDSVSVLHRDPMGQLTRMDVGELTWTFEAHEIVGAGSRVSLNDAGRPLTATPPIGPTAWGVGSNRLDYLLDADGRMEGLVGENDVLQLSHDGLGRLVSVRLGGRPGWDVEWDALGWPSRIADPSGMSTLLVHDGQRLLGLEENQRFSAFLGDSYSGTTVLGESPWTLLYDETGRLRVEQSGGAPPQGMAWSPQGFPDRAPLTRQTTLGAWELFAGGPLLDGSGARDPISGLHTAGEWTPPWWTKSPPRFSLPQQDRAAQPTWSPERFAPTSWWARPVEILFAIDRTAPLLGEDLVEAHPAPPPVGWLPAAASTPRPPWSMPSLPMPASSGLEALATRCAMAPVEAITPESFLEAVLGEEFAALPSVETLTGQDWRWWLMGMDTLVGLP